MHLSMVIVNNAESNILKSPVEGLATLSISIDPKMFAEQRIFIARAALALLWDFSHKDTRERLTLYTAGSSTLSALQAEPMRLPQEYYDVKP